MIDSYTKTPRPLRHVDVDYLINQTKCENCAEKPCLSSCPIDAIYMDDVDGLVKIKNTCFGCVLCRNACPYDAISLDVQMDPPVVHVYRLVKMVPFIFSMMERIHHIVRLIRIHVSVAVIVLEYVLLMQLNMVNYFLKLLKGVKQSLLIRINVLDV